MKYLFSGDIQYYSGRKKKKKYIKKLVLILLIILAVLFSAGSFLMIHDTYHQMFGRMERPEDSNYPAYDNSGRDTRTEVTFPSQGNQLQGYLYGPKKADTLVIISPEMGEGADSYIRETLYFVKKGFRVLAFDNTGSFDSEGDGVQGLSQSVIDLDAALTYVEHNDELKKLQVLLYGHGWGGWAVSSILHYDHDVKAVVSVAGYNSPMEMTMEWTKKKIGLLAYPEYPYIWTYQKALFGSAANLSAADCISETDIPVLIMQGSEDQKVKAGSTAIMAHKDEITNPNAEFILWEKEGQNGHSDLFLSPEKEKTSELDEVFMQDVYQFYKKALKSESKKQIKNNKKSKKM